MIWIDTDMGFDDMLAVMMIARSPKSIAGMSLIFGNAPLIEVRRNAARAAALLRWRFPILTGAAASILGSVETPAHVLGPTGIPTRGKSLADAEPAPESSAFTGLAAWLEGLEAPGDILALGPLTNIAVLALARPDLAARIGGLTWMGGGATRGNHTASAEFNAYADPEAVAAVLASGIPLRVVDLDLCRQVPVGPDDLVELEATASPKGRILADLFGAYVDIALTRGRPAMALYDPTAAAAVLLPDAFTFEPANVTMELAGTHTRGRTIVDRRAHAAPNAHWGTIVDAGRVRDLALATILEAAQA